MKQIETIKSGKNYSAVSVGKMSEIIELRLSSTCFRWGPT